LFFTKNFYKILLAEHTSPSILAQQKNQQSGCALPREG
jgi:hypothetical protein